MLQRALLIVAASLLAAGTVACGSVSSTPGTTGAGGGSAATGTGAGGATTMAQSYTVSWDAITVMPGEENTQCVVKKLSNPTAIHVGTIHNVLQQGSHHLIVYKTNDTVEQPTPFACQPFSDLAHPEKGTPLMISQKKDDTLTFPQGVAVAIGAEQFVRLELHYINPSSAPLQVSATSTFIQMPDAEVKDEAGFLFMGDIDISIPPMSSFTLGPIYAPEPSVVSGSNYFGITGHEHQWGTDVKVAMTTGATGTDTSIYDVTGWTWSEPTTVYLDPPATVPTGGGFRYTCTWNNLSTNTVTFGESANDEMCFFWTYYYPDKGAHVCFHTDQVMGGYDLCCPDSPTLCNMFLPP